MGSSIAHFGVGIGAALLTACQAVQGSPHAATPAPTPATLDAIPLKVAIAGGRVTTGAGLGVARKDVTLSAYSISKTPTTVRQYKQCVASGACTAPSIKDGACAQSQGNLGATYMLTSGTDDRPVTCVASDQAVKYCAWVGGRLPTVSEWSLAARGPAIQRYAWGSAPPTCAHRPTAGSSWAACCAKSCDSDEAVTVGTHAAGDSALGVSDILLTRGELMAAEANSVLPACRKAAGTCMATGLLPGAIDLFVPESTNAATMSPDTVASFRCAWEGAVR